MFDIGEGRKGCNLLISRRIYRDLQLAIPSRQAKIGNGMEAITGCHHRLGHQTVGENLA
jgi:hypothetical protein